MDPMFQSFPKNFWKTLFLYINGEHNFHATLSFKLTIYKFALLTFCLFNSSAK